MTPTALGTDPTMAANFLTRMASTAKLTGRPVAYLAALSDDKTFSEAAPAIAVLDYTVVGTIVNGLIEDPLPPFDFWSDLLLVDDVSRIDEFPFVLGGLGGFIRQSFASC